MFAVCVSVLAGPIIARRRSTAVHATGETRVLPEIHGRCREQRRHSNQRRRTYP